MTVTMHVEVHPFTDKGRREYQQDFFYTDPPPRAGLPWLGAVADGMGGHFGGELASHAGIHALKQTFDAAIAARRGTAEALVEAATRGHEAVLAEAEKNDEAGNMGSTIAAFAVDGATLHWCSAGDSRIYLYREQRLLQLTRDFTLAEDMRLGAEQGAWTGSEIEDSPHRNALTSFMGTGQWRYHDGQMALKPGDLIVACTDGVWGTIGADGIAAACTAGGGQAKAQQIAADMLGRVLAVGKPNQDNSTAVVARWSRPDDRALAGPRLPEPAPSLPRGPVVWGGAAVALAGLGVLGWIGLPHLLGPDPVVASAPAGTVASGRASAPGTPPLVGAGSTAGNRAGQGVPAEPDTPGSKGVPLAPAASAPVDRPATPASSAPSAAPGSYLASVQRLEADYRAGKYRHDEMPAAVRSLRNSLQAAGAAEPPDLRKRLDGLLAEATKKKSQQQAQLQNAGNRSTKPASPAPPPGKRTEPDKPQEKPDPLAGQTNKAAAGNADSPAPVTMPTPAPPPGTATAAPPTLAAPPATAPPAGTPPPAPASAPVTSAVKPTSAPPPATRQPAGAASTPPAAPARGSSPSHEGN